jgi:hypothetical protein
VALAARRELDLVGPRCCDRTPGASLKDGALEDVGARIAHVPDEAVRTRFRLDRGFPRS